MIKDFDFEDVRMLSSDVVKCPIQASNEDPKRQKSWESLMIPNELQIVTLGKYMAMGQTWDT